MTGNPETTTHTRKVILNNYGHYLARIVPRKVVMLLQIFAIETFVLL
jgi:hypothetical protein